MKGEISGFAVNMIPSGSNAITANQCDLSKMAWSWERSKEPSRVDKLIELVVHVDTNGNLLEIEPR